MTSSNDHCAAQQFPTEPTVMGNRPRPSDTNISAPEHQGNEQNVAQPSYHQSKFHPAFYNLKQDSATLAAMANYHNPGTFTRVVLYSDNTNENLFSILSGVYE